MKPHSTFLSLKGKNVNLPQRYKIRHFRSSRSNLNVEQLQQQALNLNIQQNYVPFTINSRPINQMRKQVIQLRKQQTPMKLQKKQNSLIKMPAISLPPCNLKQFKEKESQLLPQKYKTQKTISTTNKREYHSQNKIKRCTCGNCHDCMKDFAYYLHLCSDDRGVPQITAKSWCIWKRKADKFMYYYGKRIHKVRQIASLTKMITAMVMMDFLNKYQLNIAKVKYQIKKSSIMIGGTTSKLQIEQVYNLEQLLYGMMLPSGNDAAIAISEAIGLIINLKSRNKFVDPHKEGWYENYNNKNYSYLFIQAMNDKVQKLGSIDTRIYNSHGNDAYDQLKNISTCNQIAKISSQFMNYPLLRQVIKKPFYTFQNGNQIQNTNKLLDDGFEGIKTGITETAGPCLSAYYKDLIIVVLNSKSMNQRWLEVKKLVKWIKNKGC